MCMIGNHVYGQPYRGFESPPLRHPSLCELRMARPSCGNRSIPSGCSPTAAKDALRSLGEAGLTPEKPTPSILRSASFGWRGHPAESPRSTLDDRPRRRRMSCEASAKQGRLQKPRPQSILRSASFGWRGHPAESPQSTLDDRSRRRRMPCVASAQQGRLRGLGEAVTVSCEASAQQDQNRPFTPAVTVTKLYRVRWARSFLPRYHACGSLNRFATSRLRFTAGFTW